MTARRESLDQRPELAGRYRYFTSFGRTALLGSLQAAKVAGGDVFLPAFTCNTTVTSAVLQAGATPVFIDVDPRTLNMDTDQFAPNASSRLRAVISHHYYGFACTNLGDVSDFCAQRRIAHIEDCSHSLGARFGGKFTGSWGHLAVFSFSKAQPNPGGGCLSTDDPELHAAIQSARSTETCLDQCVKNYHSFGHLYRLSADAEETDLLPDLLFRISRYPLFLLQRALSYDLRRARGTFYQPEADHLLARPPMSISMTRLQKWYIETSWKASLERTRAKRNLFFRLLSSMPVPLRIEHVEPAYTTFVLEVADVGEAIASGRRQGIRLRPTWPLFQNYSEEQRTPGVRWLANHFALLSLGQYVDAHRQDRLFRFLGDRVFRTKTARCAPLGDQSIGAEVNRTRKLANN